MGQHTFDATDLPRRLRQLPGGPELLDLARGRPDVALVGGAVRDLLLERTPRELDVVIGGEDPAFAPVFLFARRLAEGLGPTATVEEHTRFGTALVTRDSALADGARAEPQSHEEHAERSHGHVARAERVQIDLAGARRERYDEPGALPRVEPSALEEDLLRRDFTVNAIAATLDPTRPGEVHAPPGALEDLRAGRLRVLHDASFLDDPTRLLRLARYAARLDFEIEPHTSTLAARALDTRALDTVSGARIGAELRLALSEPTALEALAAIDRLGLLHALHPRMRLDRAASERALELLPGDGRADLLLMAALTLPLALRAHEPLAEISALLDRLEFAAPERDRIVASAAAAPRLLDRLPASAAGPIPPSRVRAAVAGVPLEGIALAGGLSELCLEPARRWLSELRHIALAITGADLLAAGIPEGPEVGRRLEVALDLKLDSELAGGREAELDAAMQARA